MAKTLYSDLIGDDGAFDRLDKSINESEANFTASIKAMIAIGKELQATLKEALNAPKQDNAKITSLTSKSRALTQELKATKRARKELNVTKKKFIELSIEEQRAIIKDSEATRVQKKELRLLERAQIAEIGTLAKLRAAINADESALEHLNITTRKGRKEATLFAAQLKKKKEALRKVEFAIGKYNSNVGNYPKLANAATVATRQLVAAFGLYQGIAFAKSIINEIKEVESLNLALKTVTRTTAEYNASQLFLRDIAQDYGIEVNRLTRSYVKFAASLKDTGITLIQGKGLFESVAKSSAVLGVSAEETEGALKALGQILSKGKVQAEELRGQLGDRLPGVMQIVADVTGKTTAELDKMLKAGELLAVDVLPKLAKGFEKAYNTEHIKTVETLTAKTAQFSNAWKFLIRTIDDGDGAISRTFKTITGGLTSVLNLISKASKRSELKNTILGDNYFGAIAGGGAQAKIRINATIDEIIKSFEKLQKEATSKDFLDKITSEIEIYEKTLSQLEEKAKSGNLSIINAAINEGEIDVILYQLQRLRMLTIDAKEAEADRAAEAKKYNEQIEKTYETESLLAIAAKLKKQQEDARLPKMKEITDEHKFQAEEADGLSTLYSEQERKILAIKKAHDEALKSAEKSKKSGEELLEILRQQEKEQLFSDAREGFITLINAIDEAREAAYQRNISRIDNETAKISSSIDDQRERARLGLDNQLGDEEKALEKQELKKERLRQKNERRQKAALFLNTVNSMIESGKQPAQALAEAAATTLAVEAFAASFKDGGLVAEAIDAKGGSNRYGAINNGYVTGVSHGNKSGGIPVLVEKNEGIISGQAMGGFDSSEQFKEFHSFLKHGGKYNDLIKGNVQSIVHVKGSDNSAVVKELRGVKSLLGNLESQKIEGNLLGEIVSISETVKRHGQMINNLYYGNNNSPKRGNSTNRGRP